MAAIAVHGVFSYFFLQILNGHTSGGLRLRSHWKVALRHAVLEFFQSLRVWTE